MTAMGIPANAKQLAALVKEGEGPALEFNRSTRELKEGLQTFRAIAQAADRFENRVIAMCRKHGASPPAFEERSGFLIVTFKAQLVAEGESGIARDRAVLGPG
jgi:hypothetical protein